MLQQLSGLDAAFLAMDSGSNYGHVGSVSILQGSDGLTLERLTETFGSRLHLVPLFTRRLVQVPLGIDQPYWIEDPDFDLEFHVREIALPSPGDDRQLAEQIGRLHSRPLDRARPLWEAYLIYGLEGERQALYTKVHHAAIDGASGGEALGLLMDPDPEGRTIAPAPERVVESAPSGLSLLRRSVGHLAFQPIRAARVMADLTGALPGIARAFALAPAGTTMDGAVLSRTPVRPPSTPFNRNVTPHRRWSFRWVLLDDVKQVRVAHGGSVNDVVMAMCAGAVRRWLSDHEALPEGPLVAGVPISVRTEDKKGAFGNEVNMLMSLLPTNLADPFARLRAVQEAMRVAKEQHAAIPARVLSDITQFSMPALTARASRLAAQLRLAERSTPLNLVISNVPGPRNPLYFGGARMLATYPVSAIADGIGLNITVTGYGDGLGFGLVACRELVPDLDDLAGHLIDELALLKATS
ncbi:MAG TPA: wax ester/triacylglycerol synthase family O-acyltransferase [Kineosporiaceae bacterium]|nr:wax ester/triacylglycerol synthase family O-acyltransferase [Kineosporiaceae bacterium]